MIRALKILFVLILSTGCLFGQPVRVGADLLLGKHLDLVKGRRVAVVCNHTSVLANGAHIVDTLLQSGVNITKLFAPEHGIRGDIPAGDTVRSAKDPKTGLIVYSLYGGTRKPSLEMLLDVDVILFDMQDVGARFYTYASTMAYVMMAGAENGKKVIVLDRPNPINGIDVEGPVLDLSLRSFIGLFPAPVRHGLTIGEIAKMIVGEGYINPSDVDLTVIPMEGWKRTMWYDETGLPWIAPSPNMRSLETATVYPGTCLFEATNISEGRGTPRPFEYIGAPKIDGTLLASKLNALKLDGVMFKAVKFIPKADEKRAREPKFNKKPCSGVHVIVTDRNKFKPVITGLMMIGILREIYPKTFQLRKGLFDRLIGDELVSERLILGKMGNDVFKLFKSQFEEYKKIRSKYLLY